jgi:hypothetical protein
MQLTFSGSAAVLFFLVVSGAMEAEVAPPLDFLAVLGGGSVKGNNRFY